VSHDGTLCGVNKIKGLRIRIHPLLTNRLKIRPMQKGLRWGNL
jgi:hypothetical protein